MSLPLYLRGIPWIVKLPTFRGVLKTAGLLISWSATAILFNNYVLDVTTGSGPSMFPTMPSEKSITLVSKLHSRGRGVKIGDIIVAENPLFPNYKVGKRIVGMPGDYVVNNPYAPTGEGGGYLLGRRVPENNESEPMMEEVPEGHVWLSGDNLAWSRDSRFYGPLPMALIEGKVLAIGKGYFSGWRWLDVEALSESAEELEVKKQRELRGKQKG